MLQWLQVIARDQDQQLRGFRPGHSWGSQLSPVECEVCAGLGQWPDALPRATALPRQEEMRAGKSSSAPKALSESHKTASTLCFCSSRSIKYQKVLTVVME